MKKLYFMAVMAIAAVTLTSCGGSAPQVHLKQNVDSLSYAYGAQIAESFNRYHMMEQLEIDSANIKDFEKGLIEAVRGGDSKKAAAYYKGIAIGLQLLNEIDNVNTQLKASGDTLLSVVKNNYIAAFINTVRGVDGPIDSNVADSLIGDFQRKAQAEQRARERELSKAMRQQRWHELDSINGDQFNDYKELNAKFLAENKAQEGVLTTPSGLQYKVITMGDGAKPSIDNVVSVDYEGRLIDGTVFDSSYDSGQPARFYVDRVIEGWTEALQLMPVGSEFELYIPQELAYGPQETGDIKPYSTLIFKVKLNDILQ